MHYTEQEVYELVRAWIANEDHVPAISTSTGGCRYRTEDGNCCAIGSLIPPAVYNPSMEGAGIYRLLTSKDLDVNKRTLEQLRQMFEGCDPNFLSHVQMVHDNTWRHANREKALIALDEIASSHGLVLVTKGISNAEGLFK